MKNGFTLAEGATHVGTGKGSRAFTLAEVLITLGIIGFVAAIPMMITNYQKHVTVTQLKKAYTEFAQALQKAACRL